MISNAKGSHVSPGVYTEEKDVTYSVKSLGITSAGLVGETLYGPAFENIEISEWSDFIDYFGGTSPEKYKGTGLPKYELPYVAKSYLEQSKRLNVVRVLGLSGYHAGPCWVITYKNDKCSAEDYNNGNCTNKCDCGLEADAKPMVILRSNMVYGGSTELCTPGTDDAIPLVDTITIGDYKGKIYNSQCALVSTESVSLRLDCYPRFSIIVKPVGSEETVEYNVSMNPKDSDYIYKVLPSTPDQNSLIYIEAAYDSDLPITCGVDNGCVNYKIDISEIKSDSQYYNYYDDYTDAYRPGQTPWLVSEAYATALEQTSASTEDTEVSEMPVRVNYKKVNNCEITSVWDASGSTLTLNVNDSDDVKIVKLLNESGNEITPVSASGDTYVYNITTSDEQRVLTAVMGVEVEGYMITVDETMAPTQNISISGSTVSGDVVSLEVTVNPNEGGDVTSMGFFDENNQYYAFEDSGNTLEITSSGTFTACIEYPKEEPQPEMKVTMRKLFKFITISDGNAANYQVKVSIQKIDPTKGTFDVIVRDFNDSDENPFILEKFSKCTLNKGDSSYIGYKIGTADGIYPNKSKYVTVLFASEDDFSGSVPCGFLGYPTPSYFDSKEESDNKFITPSIAYNLDFNVGKKAKKQYFGFNTRKTDVDILSYKGTMWTENDFDDYYPYITIGKDEVLKSTHGFHMDSIFAHSNSDNVFVDGIKGYTFDGVSTEKVTTDEYEPRLINAPSYVNNTIYKDENLRKFTVCFYGGFDGWDINETERTNTDNYSSVNYSAKDSHRFKLVSELPFATNLPSTAITSDYYAYLYGYRIFANPQDIDINVFATPGIDWYNQRLLTHDVIDMIEDPDDGRGGDALYIMNAPYYETNTTDPRTRYKVVDKVNVDTIVDYFEESDINSSYTCTYYPWILYYDRQNSQYITLPPTKDVIRNIAETDNTSYPWFAPAGFERGNVVCERAEFKTTLQQEDSLYENNINPVKTFGRDGVKIWGNKTAYAVDSPLNRVNVRRLMIRVKKLVTSAAKNLIFEQYTDSIDKQFRGLVEPILSDVKSNRGITDYKVITEVTPETKDQHILPAKIMIKPTPALEYITISFVVYPESVEFSE